MAIVALIDGDILLFFYLRQWDVIILAMTQILFGKQNGLPRKQSLWQAPKHPFYLHHAKLSGFAFINQINNAVRAFCKSL